MLTICTTLERLSDRDLVAAVRRLAAREAVATAYLVASLGELDSRRLYLAEGCSSLFAYCTEVLGLSEGGAYRRIEAARLARRFPLVLQRLAIGAIHLTALHLLAPHLTPENHKALLDSARGRGKRAVEELVARIAPRPDAPSLVRKLPQPKRSAESGTPSSLCPAQHEQDDRVAPCGERAVAASAADRASGRAEALDWLTLDLPGSVGPAEQRAGESPLAASAEGASAHPGSESARPSAGAASQAGESTRRPESSSNPTNPTDLTSPVDPAGRPAVSTSPAPALRCQPGVPIAEPDGYHPAVLRAAPRATVMPLAPERYRVQMTVGAETHAKLRRVQDLLRHSNPDGDIAMIFDRALTLLLSNLERKKLALTERPRTCGAASGGRCARRRTVVHVSRTATMTPVSDASDPNTVEPPMPGSKRPVAAAPEVDGRAAPGPAAVSPAGVCSESDGRAQRKHHRDAVVEPDGRAPATAARGPADRPPGKVRSRYIPAAVKRAVWARDQGRCTYIGPAGRCGQTGGLEFHHRVPFAVGGPTTVDGLTLRCKPHNIHDAEEYFGRRHGWQGRRGS